MQFICWALVSGELHLPSFEYLCVLAKHLHQTPNAVEPYVIRPSNQTAYILGRTQESLSSMLCTTSINADGLGLNDNAWLCSWRLRFLAPASRLLGPSYACI